MHLTQWLTIEFAPVVLGCSGTTVFDYWNRPRLGRWLGFFLSACLLHSIVDVLTHNDDGPVLFFPFNWQYRFSSPVSYWDRDHFGGTFIVFEFLLDVGLVGFLIWSRRRKPDAEKQ